MQQPDTDVVEELFLTYMERVDKVSGREYTLMLLSFSAACAMLLEHIVARGKLPSSEVKYMLSIVEDLGRMLPDA